MATPIGESNTRNRMMGTEQTAKILLSTTEIGGYVFFESTLRADTDNRTDPTIQPIIINFKQVTAMGQSDQNQYQCSNVRAEYC